MKSFQANSMAAAMALTSTLIWSAANADDVGGGPRADFRDDELSIPCVKVEHLGAKFDDNYYDVILDRRGRSYNFELIAAEAEDNALCMRLAAIAAFEDDDYAHDSHGPGDNGYGILVRCDRYPGRSRVSVEAKDLPSGRYFAAITSGNNEEFSLPLTIFGDELEFEFDSDDDSIDDGAYEISRTFIANNLEVTAEIINDATDRVVYSAMAQCLVD